MKTKPIRLMLAAALLVAGQVAGQPSKPAIDPFKDDVTGEDTPSPDLLIRYEVFSIDLRKSAQLRRSQPGDARFYEEVVSLAAQGGGCTQESLMVIRARSGQKSVLSSVREIIYPTAYQQWVMKTQPDADEKDAKAKPAAEAPPPAPTACETRNVGEVLEVEGTLGEDQKLIYLHMLPDHTAYMGRVGYPSGAHTLEMPRFESQQIKASANLTPGTPFFWGTSKAVGDAGKPDERVWLAFVTVDLAKKQP